MANPYLQKRAPSYQGGPQRAPVRKRPNEPQGKALGWRGQAPQKPKPQGGQMTPQQRQQRQQASDERYFNTFTYPQIRMGNAAQKFADAGWAVPDYWAPYQSMAGQSLTYTPGMQGGPTRGGGGGGQWGGPQDGRPNPNGGGGGAGGGGGNAGGGGGQGGGTPTLPLDPVFEAQRRLFEDQLAAQLGMLAPLRAQIEAQTNLQGQRLNTNETVDKARLLESLASRGALRGGIQTQDEGYLGTDYLRQRQDLATDAAQQYGGLATQEGQARLQYMQMLQEALIEAAQRAQQDPYAVVPQQGMGDANYGGGGGGAGSPVSGGPIGGRPGPTRGGGGGGGGGGWQPSWKPSWSPKGTRRRKAGR